MSLSRQLTILVALLVASLFVGSFVISVHNARNYLESQLASHAQDAATSLGLSATAHVASGDRAMVTAMVNAIFHRGDYLSIRLEDLSGEQWLERAAELQVDDVPTWFVRLIRLHPPQRSAGIMSGWHQLGRVDVVSHPGLAYRKLWQTTTQMLSLFLIGALLALLAGIAALRWLLRPLKEVEQQALAICDREYPVVDHLPFTTEFRRVVDAMNHLSRKVGRALAESERRAIELREQAFQDPVTGLANRRRFVEVLAHRVAEPELLQTGGLLLVELNGLADHNQTHGYAAGDRWLKESARVLDAALVDEPSAMLGRLSGGDFAVLLDGASEERMHGLAERLTGGLTALYASLGLPSPDVAHAGGVVYGGQTVAQLLAEADGALREAQCRGPNAWVIRSHRAASEPAQSTTEWRALIERALGQREFHLVRQPVVATVGDELLHHEVFLRIQEPGSPDRTIAAARFMPMAEHTGLAPSVDKAVMETVMRDLQAGAFPGQVAVNLSAASLLETELLDWMQGELKQRPAVAEKLILELPEYGAMAQVSRLVDWVGRLDPLGVKFSLDHFGKGFGAFADLRSLKLAYIKVDGSLVRNLHQQESNRFYLRAIVDIAHGLDMHVIAESVETDADWRLLPGLGIDGGRGYWLGAPK